MTERLLVVGATSAIAQAVSRRFAARGARLYLLARNAPLLAVQQADLEVRGAAQVRVEKFEATDIAGQAGLVSLAFAAWGGFDAVLVAFGDLPDQKSSEASVDQMLASFDTNARSTLALLTSLTNALEQQSSGALAVISSVAGARGRASNYVYGSSKAAVTAFCSGIRQRLHPTGVRVITVLPGFVDTPMTASFPKGPLWASPERVAGDIDRALASRSGTLYTPWFWRWIMLIIASLPEWLFVRLKL